MITDDEIRRIMPALEKRARRIASRWDRRQAGDLAQDLVQAALIKLMSCERPSMKLAVWAMYDEAVLWKTGAVRVSRRRLADHPGWRVNSVHMALDAERDSLPGDTSIERRVEAADAVAKLRRLVAIKGGKAARAALALTERYEGDYVPSDARVAAGVKTDQRLAQGRSQLRRLAKELLAA